VEGGEEAEERREGKGARGGVRKRAREEIKTSVRRREKEKKREKLTKIPSSSILPSTTSEPTICPDLENPIATHPWGRSLITATSMDVFCIVHFKVMFAIPGIFLRSFNPISPLLSPSRLSLLPPPPSPLIDNRHVQSMCFASSTLK
jgi:hypothetical protein